MKNSSLKYLLLAGMAGGVMAFTNANAQEGSISGTVTPADAAAVAWTVVGEDTLKAAADATTGAFEITGVPAGDYTVTIDGADPYADATVEVTVTDGQAADVGEIQLEGAVDEATDAAGDLLEDGSEATEGTLDDAGDAADGALDDAGNATDGVLDDAGNAADHASDKAFEATENASENALEGADNAAGNAAEATEDAAESAGDATEAAGDDLLQDGQ